MRNLLLALILLMAFVAPLHAQTTLKAIPITSANQLVDGGTYLISAFSSKKKEYYCDFHIQRIKETEDFYWLKKISVFNQPEQAAAESDLLVMQYSGGRWFLYSPQANGYIGPDVESIQQRALVSPSQTDDNAITFELTDEGLQMKFGNGSYLWYNSTSKVYQFTKHASDDRINILLYLIEDVPTTLLNADGLATPVDGVADVKWVAKWHKDYYNTLCVPFDIEDYHSVFGSSSSVYQLKSSLANNVCFERMGDGEVLKANTPYLLKWVSGADDTLHLSNVHLHTDSLRTPIFGNDTICIQGTYQPMTLSGRGNAFVLYRDQFVCCKNQDSLRLPPFHWYIVLRGDSQRPLKLGVGR